MIAGRLDTEDEADFEALTRAPESPNEHAYRLADHGGYENAPATRMLATHCAACGRPLVDANSVEAGMGPDCREKYGCSDAVDEARRGMANALIHGIALARKEGTAHIGAAQAAERLRDMGLPRLADVVLKALVKVRIQEVGGRLALKTPFSPEAVARLRSIPGRRWDAEGKVNTFPMNARQALWQALQDLFPGQVGLGPRGVFRIGGAS